jgi:NtrC-family two-component system response regulator AlgB
MRRLLEVAKQAAVSSAPISLLGESGTGKTLLARQIHQWSPRRLQAFSIIDCAGLAQRSVTGAHTARFSEYQRGTCHSSQWFEDTGGGTLYLAGVDRLPPSFQDELARFINNRTVHTREVQRALDVRIIAASDRDFTEDVKANRFRADLFYALNILSLRVPPLRERPGDICPLAARFLCAAAIRNGRGNMQLSNEAAAALTLYRWPGNVRELRNAMEAAAVLSRGQSITLADLPESIANYARTIVDPRSSTANAEQIERERISRVLAESRTLAQAAATLRMNVATLWRKRKHLKLTLATSRKK